MTILTGCSSSIQKSVNVLESVANPYGGRWKDPQYVSLKCYETFIDQSKLNNLLSDGVKVISSSKVKTPVKYIRLNGLSANGICNGTRYILEGPKSKFNRL